MVGPGIPGIQQEWQGFLASGKTIAPTDLVEFSIGGNDARAYYRGGGTLAGVNAAATTSFNQTMAGVNALVGATTRAGISARPQRPFIKASETGEQAKPPGRPNSCGASSRSSAMGRRESSCRI